MTLEQIAIFSVIVLGVLVLMSAIFAVLQCLLRPNETKKRDEKFEQAETSNDLDEENDGDLHTARGGIVYQDM